jgi:hypothetical protein
MTDFFTPVQIQRAAFDVLIRRVDEAVSKHAVALVLNEDFPFRGLDPVSPTAIDLSGLELEQDPLDIVNYLDQLMYFAFEEAPDEVIASWANDFDKELSREAVDRVKFIYANMPALLELWNAKSNSILPPLINFGYDVTTTLSGNRHASLYFAVARIAETGRPDKTDVSRLRVQLWPSDVRILIRELEHLWSAHLMNLEGGEDGGEGNGDDETSKANS